MGDRWTTDRVLALAPDASSVSAGRKLATPRPWVECGATDAAVWGKCAGSGKVPYSTIVDLTGPAYTCSCPSRKFPCKHALGLLLLWSQREVPDVAEPSDYAASWLTGRTTRAAAKAAAADPTAAPKDPERAAKTAAQRAERVRSGIDELRLWLTDQVGHGLSGLDVDPYRRFDAVAARLVDAQAPGVAGRVRRMPTLIAGTASAVEWPSRVLEEFGRLWSLTTAHQHLDQLTADPGTADLAATVRRHVGYPVAKADVLATDGITDVWLCLGRRDTEEDHLHSRRTWMWGAGTRRFGLVMDYAPTAATLPLRPVVGESIVTTMHFYPGVTSRCLYDEATPTPQNEHAPDPVDSLDATDIAAARRARARAIADDPWTSGCPVLLDGRLGLADDATPALVDADGTAIPITGIGDRWPLLLAHTAGARAAVFGHLDAAGLDVMSVIVRGEVIAL